MNAAIWIWLFGSDSQGRLGQLRRSAVRALRAAQDKGAGIFVANHQLDIFLIEPDTDRYLGGLCSFNQCPKGKPECRVVGCGAVPFNKQVAAFTPDADLLASARLRCLRARRRSVALSP